MKKIFLLILVSIFLISIVSAFNFEDEGLPKLESGYVAPLFNNSTAFVNLSNWANVWITNEGDLDNVADIEHNWLSNLAWSVAGHTIDTNLDMNDNNITNADWTNSNYFSGQPIDGSIGSGILNASSLKIHCGCINASDEGGLDVWYPDTLVKIWNYGTNVYCNIAENTYTVPDDAHTVYYVDSACAVQTATWENYFAQDINSPNYIRLFDVYTNAGDIGVLKGGSVLGINSRKTKWNSVNCEGGGHLSVCDGMDITQGIFPEVNMSAGHFKYLNSVLISIQRDSNPDGLHVICTSDESHTAETEIDIDKCDNGVSCDACPDNKFRRYIIGNVGWGVEHTEIHQLAPLDGDTFNNLIDCINVEKYPLDYTVPSNLNGVFVPLAFYCGRRDDTAWNNGFVDLRLSGGGFGASPDLSGFVPYNDANANVDLGNYNLTGLDYLQGDTINFTTAYIGELTWNGNLDLGGNNLTNGDWLNTNNINSTDNGEIKAWQNITFDNGYGITFDNGAYITENNDDMDFVSSDEMGFWVQDQAIWNMNNQEFKLDSPSRFNYDNKFGLDVVGTEAVIYQQGTVVNLSITDFDYFNVKGNATITENLDVTKTIIADILQGNEIHSSSGEFIDPRSSSGNIVFRGTNADRSFRFSEDSAGVSATAYGTVANPYLRLSSEFGGQIRIFKAGNIVMGGTTSAYPLQVFGSNETNQSITIWAENNISATGFITRTSTFDSSKNPFDYIKDVDYYRDGEEVNHSKFYGYVTWEAIDFDKPEYVEMEDGEIDTLYPFNKIESGVELGMEIDLLRQASYELKQENDLLKSQLQEVCKLPNTKGVLSWC